MSVETIKDLSFLPKKKSHEIMLVPTIGTSRCGEIFVTNNADKWTFVCSLCQKATNDIGVFICHIRFDHLNSLQGLQQVKEIAPMSSIPISNLFPREEEQKMENNLILENDLLLDTGTVCSRVSKIVDISSLTDIATENITSNKNSDLTSYPSQEINEELFTQQTNPHSVQENKKILKETGGDNTSLSQHETIAIDDDEDTFDSETISAYSPNENNIDDSNENVVDLKPNDDSGSTTNGNNNDDSNGNIVDLESNNDNKASGSKRKINYPEHTCDFCNMSFNYKSSLDFHVKKLHTQANKMPLNCKKCRRTFQTVPGFKNHLKSHDKKNRLKCSICKVKHKSIYYFITHVLTHESDTCFPCQVCGNIYTSEEKRMEHWKSHAKELPFNCTICNRRYRKQQYLTAHKKSHLQYQCQFCPSQFSADEQQERPYACPTCENKPDIKERVQHQRLLANNPHVFDSDEDSTLASNSENEHFAQNDSDPDKDSTAIEKKTIDSAANLNNNEDNDHDVLNNDGMDLEFVDEVKDEIGASGSGTYTSPFEDDNSQHKCNYCNKVFRSKHGVYLHIVLSHDKNYHSRFPFKCRHCNRGFRSKPGLSYHEKTHDKSKALNCPVCLFSDFRENDFLSHVMKHETELCFPCQVCAKIFPNNIEREEHYKTHIKDRPYGCDFCFRRFFLKRILSQHLRTHGLYKCFVCTITFNSKQNPPKPYVCPSCKQNPNLTEI